MPVKPTLLKELAPLAGLSAEDTNALAGIMDIVACKEGERIFHSGEIPAWLMISLSGDFLVSSDKNRSRTLHGPGQVFGVNPQQAPGCALPEIRALTDSRMLAVRWKDLAEPMARSDTLARRLTRTLARADELQSTFSTEV